MVPTVAYGDNFNFLNWCCMHPAHHVCMPKAYSFLFHARNRHVFVHQFGWMWMSMIPSWKFPLVVVKSSCCNVVGVLYVHLLPNSIVMNLKICRWRCVCISCAYEWIIFSFCLCDMILMQLKAGDVRLLATVAFGLVKHEQTSEIRHFGLKMLQVSSKILSGSWNCIDGFLLSLRHLRQGRRNLESNKESINIWTAASELEELDKVCMCAGSILEYIQMQEWKRVKSPSSGDPCEVLLQLFQ